MKLRASKKQPSPLSKCFGPIKKELNSNEKRSFVLNVAFGKVDLSADNNKKRKKYANLFDALQKEDVKSLDYLRKPIKFKDDDSKEFIIKSVVGDYCSIYDKSSYAKRGKNPRICKWNVHGVYKETDTDIIKTKMIGSMFKSKTDIIIDAAESTKMNEFTGLIIMDAK